MSRQRSPLHFRPPIYTHHVISSHAVSSRPFRLRPRIIVCELNPDLAGVLALAVESLPNVALATSGYDDLSEADPCLADQIGSLVFAEDGQLQLVVIGRVMDGESELLVPGVLVSTIVQDFQLSG